MRIHDLNCGSGRPLGCRLLRALPDRMVCRCLLIDAADRRILIDTGIGLADIARPGRRLGMMRFGLGLALDPAETAVRQASSFGPVTDIVLTHLDVDHVGGLTDLPDARVHVSGPELAVATGRSIAARLRYRPASFGPTDGWRVYPSFEPEGWLGLDAARLELPAPLDLRLVRLPGHTLEHCGVAIGLGEDRWLLHAGDAYYGRRELNPASDSLGLTVFRRLIHMRPGTATATRNELRALLARHGDRVRVCNTHDPGDGAP